MNEKEREIKMIEEAAKIRTVELYRDALIVAGFVILAIAFQKWWVSLFSILVLIIVKAADNVRDGKDE